jgi:integrase
MRWAKAQGYIDVNAIEDLEQPKGGKREMVLTSEEYEAILATTPNEDFLDLVRVTWETGCRPQESLRVEGRHVDLANHRWVFPVSESKTGIPRVVYLTDTALAITKRRMKHYPAGKLFRNSRGKPWTTDAVSCCFTTIQIRLGRKLLQRQNGNRQISTNKRRKYVLDDEVVMEYAKTLNPIKQSGDEKSQPELLHEARRKLIFKEAKRLAPKYSLYAIRHTWMNRLLKEGVDSLTVAFLAGHSDPSTLAKVYAHLSQDPEYLLKQAQRASV